MARPLSQKKKVEEEMKRKKIISSLHEPLSLQ
jgi:hypothetical protein